MSRLTTRLVKQPARRLFLSGVARGVRIPEYPLNRYHELLHLNDLLEILEINCVLDVGANRGQFASLLRASGYGGFICSFEPVEHAFRIMQDEFRDDPLWSGHRVALGSENTRMTMNVIPTFSVMSSLLTPRESFGEIKEEEVEVRRLEELFDEAVSAVSNPRVFLKMDTQGFDLEVFKGAEGCIARVRGLASELSVIPLYDGMPTYLEALAEYEQAGFRLYDMAMVSRGSRDELLELNCFMQRTEPQPDASQSP